MKSFIESVKFIFAAIWEMRTAEQIRQYEYDNGNGEVE